MAPFGFTLQNRKKLSALNFKNILKRNNRDIAFFCYVNSFRNKAIGIFTKLNAN